MRRTAVGAVVAALVTSGLFTPTADAAPVPVDGDHFGGAHLKHVAQGCENPMVHPSVAPVAHIKRGPKKTPLGQHSLGWDMKGQTLYGTGVLAHVPDPKKFKTTSIKTLFVGGSGEGVAYAVYHAPNDIGVWRGVADLRPDSKAGWHRVDTDHLKFTWQHYTSDTPNASDGPLGLRAMARAHGGNGHGAEIGFLFGCSGETFYVDDFRVSSKKVHRTYDLGGYRTVSDIVWGSVVRKKITITYGQRLGLSGRLRTKHDHAARSVRLALQAKPAGSKKWHRFDRIASGHEFKISPARNTTYRSTFGGSKTLRASEPKSLQVRVRSRVQAGLVDATVTKGRKFTVAGKVLPRHATKVRLQRFVHKKWRTVKVGRAGKSGGYRISAVAGSLGTSFWRIDAANGGGNLGNKSRQMKLKVSAPHHSGGGNTHSDPPPPPDDPPPPTEPPPPSHRVTVG